MNMNQSVLENQDYKILQDFSIQTNHVIEARGPDFWLSLIRRRELVKSLILQFLEIVGLKRGKKRR